MGSGRSRADRQLALYGLGCSLIGKGQGGRRLGAKKLLPGRHQVCPLHKTFPCSNTWLASGGRSESLFSFSLTVSPVCLWTRANCSSVYSCPWGQIRERKKEAERIRGGQAAGFPWALLFSDFFLSSFVGTVFFTMSGDGRSCLFPKHGSALGGLMPEEPLNLPVQSPSLEVSVFPESLPMKERGEEHRGRAF